MNVQINSKNKPDYPSSTYHPVFFQKMSSSFKLLLIGHHEVGKTTFIKRHLTGNFEISYIPTLGADFHTIKFSASNKTDIQFDIWDIAGQDKFISAGTTGYYSNANCAICLMLRVVIHLSLFLKYFKIYIKYVPKIYQ